jgi:hypothetical protein
MYSQDQVSQIQAAYEQAMKQREQDIIKQTSAFGKVHDEDLIKWQLELDNILERIDHLLRAQTLEFKDGNVIWIAAKSEKDQIMNNYGVNEILRILSMYLNRNTILSNYTEEQVEFKTYDVGNEISDLILNKYEEMGLDTYDKMVMYPMIIRELVDIIHSAYLRALKGGERESLREARHITQSLPIAGAMPFMPQQKERSPLNPARYLLGRYK